MAPAPKLAFLTGTAREAGILRKNAVFRDHWPMIGLSAMQPERARAELGRMAAAGAEAFVSFGFAGGLDRNLAAGALILASGVSGPFGDHHRCDATLIQSLATALRKGRGLLPPAAGLVAGRDRAILSAVDKSDLRQETNAVAVDMESHIVAAAAEEANVPFAVLRAIVDDAATQVPEFAMTLVDADGRARPSAVVRCIVEDPRRVAKLVTLGRQSMVAGDTLGAAVRALFAEIA